MTVEGEDAFCVDINTNFRNGYKTRADASTRMSYDQISDVALSIEYVNQYVQSHSGLSSQHIYLLKQCVVWQRLSVHLGWQCDNVRASYDEIPKAIQDEVYAGAKAFASENKGHAGKDAGLDKPTGRTYAENAEKDRRWQQHKLSERD